MAGQSVRVVVYREGAHWVAQMLEHDICAQGPDLTTVRERFLATFRAELAASVKAGHRNLEDIAPAPAHFEELWDNRSPFEEHVVEHDPVSASNDLVAEVQLAIAA